MMDDIMEYKNEFGKHTISINTNDPDHIGKYIFRFTVKLEDYYRLAFNHKCVNPLTATNFYPDFTSGTCYRSSYAGCGDYYNVKYDKAVFAESARINGCTYY